MSESKTLNSSEIHKDSISYYHIELFEEVITWIILCVGLPAISMASYALYRLVKADHVAPLYVINLLISDLAQIVARVVLISKTFLNSSPELMKIHHLFLVVVRFGLIASLGFMVCISLERYLVVSHPLWYRYHRNVKHSVLLSLAIWVVAVIYASIDYNVLKDQITFSVVFSILFLAPSPLLVFFYVSSRRALSNSVSVSVAEKKRILGALALVLCIYIVFYFPFTLISFFLAISKMKTFTLYCFVAITRSMVRLTPLVDPFLYIFMRKGARDTFVAFPCCRFLGWSTSSDDEDSKTMATISMSDNKNSV